MILLEIWTKANNKVFFPFAAFISLPSDVSRVMELAGGGLLQVWVLVLVLLAVMLLHRPNWLQPLAVRARKSIVSLGQKERLVELKSFNWNILPTMHLSRSQGLIFVSTSVELAFGVASVWVSLQVALPMAGFWIVTIAVVGGCWRLNCSMAPTDPRPIWKEMGMKNDNTRWWKGLMKGFGFCLHIVGG